MTSVPRLRSLGQVPEAIHNQLWECIDSRLARGDTLVRPRDFQVALETDYVAITGQRVDRTVRRALANAVVTINRSSPERYVAAGVQNSARRAFQSACTTLRWDPMQIRMSGLMAIARFTSHDRVRELLTEVGLKPSVIDVDACVSHALEVAAGEREPLTRHDLTEPLVATAPELTVVSRDDEGAGGADRQPDAVADEDAPLSFAERRQGALIGRVEMRVAGTTRKVPHKLMPSPGDSGTYLLAQRNAETGELAPMRRRGALRPVARGIDGVWRESS